MQYFDELKIKCIDKLARTSERIKDSIPHTTVNGKYDDVSNRDYCSWTASFWAGIMWQMYRETEEAEYRTFAENIEKWIENKLYSYEEMDHDIGFLWLLSGVENYEITGNVRSKNNSLLAASVLSSRFNLNGRFIRAWNRTGDEGKAIIDCMMNLDLLFWASRQASDNGFYNVAKAHADTTEKYFIREDGSVRHIVEFDTVTGEKINEYAGQGYSVGSSWTRCQAWAIYGFAQTFQNTKDNKFLKTSIKVADYFIEEAKKNNWRVKCDFRQPEEDLLYDTSAAAIAACGMIEIYKLTQKKDYLNSAIMLIKICDKEFCPWNDLNDEALLNYGCEKYARPIQLPLIYGDYYFFKAVCKLSNMKNEGYNNEYDRKN